MKFSIPRDAIFSALQAIQSVVEKKNSMQILGYLLVTAKGQELSLEATDMEVGMKIVLPAQIDQEGKITILARQFYDIVKELPSKTIHLTRKQNDWIELQVEKKKLSLVSLSAEQYPALPSFEDRTYYSARAEVFADMIDKTAFAVSTDAARHVMNGVYFEKLDSGMMRMVASDGHRLSFVDHEVFLTMPEIKRGVIIPRKGLSEIRKLLNEAEKGTVDISFDRGYIYVKGPHLSLFVRLLEGEYPDYKVVLPQSANKTLLVDRAQFIESIRVANLLAHEKSHGIKFMVHPKTLTIIASNPDTGNSVEELEVEYDGEATEIGLNAKFLLDCLPVIESEKVEFRFKDKVSPCLFQGIQQKNHTYVVMPMRV